MDPITSFSGLQSGLDFRSLVDQIIQVQSRPVTLLQDRITRIESRSQAYLSFKDLVSTLKDASAAVRNPDTFGTRSVDVGSQSLLSASATSGAALGTHQVKVLALASSEKLGGQSFGDTNVALGLSGEFLVNGERVSVSVTDTLNDIAGAINVATRGGAATGVSASVLSVSSSEHRLILSSEVTGSAGIELADGADGLLRSLGLLDTTVAIRNQTSDGAQSNAFANSTQSISSLLGLQSSGGPQIVDIGGVAVTVDLATMSLSDIVNEINTQATLAGSAVTAQVVSDTVNGASVHRLDISNTTSFTDSGSVLELLGVLEGGKSGVAQELQSGGALIQADGSTPALASTTLASLTFAGLAGGVQVGDTVDFNGTRGDGSAFAITYTVGVGDTVQDVLDRLNSNADGLQFGSRTATASLGSDGRIVLTDDAGGGSRLSLAAVAHNEGGGRFDLGSFDVTQAGRSRQISAGADAELEIDGVYVTRSSNTVDDAVGGLTLNLQGADVNSIVSVSISEDTSGANDAITNFVKSYNEMMKFVNEQLSSGGEGTTRGALASDATLRGMAFRLKTSMRAQIAPGIAGGMSRLLDLGISIQQDGTFLIDGASLRSALQADSGAVQKLFGLYGTGSVSELGYLSAGDDAVSGTYAVAITQAATQATLLGVGFGGSYVDDATADTLTVRDVASNATYSVALQNGDTLQTVIDRLNTEFGTGLQEVHQASASLHSDALGTAAGESTLLQDIFDSGGSNSGIQSGDSFSISGTAASGASFLTDFTVSDASTQTVGDLLAAVRAQVGPNTDVTLDASGTLTATERSTGSSLFTLSITSDNAGGGTFSFGTIQATQEGRSGAGLVASDQAGQLQLHSDGFGSSQGFEVTFAAGGGDGTASLGLTAGTYIGLDVQGTIGGLAATGTGQTLTGDAGSSVSGLVIEYTGVGSGAIGDISFSRGIASLLEIAANGLITGDDGSIDALVERANEQVDGLELRIESFEARLERRRDALIRRFVAAEQALALSEQQTSFLLGSLPQLGSFANNRRSS